MSYKAALVIAKIILLLIISKQSYAVECDPLPVNTIYLPSLLQEHTATAAGQPVSAEMKAGRNSFVNCTGLSGMGKIEMHFNVPQAPSMTSDIFSTPIPGLGFKIKISPTVGDTTSAIHIESGCTYSYLSSKVQKICDIDYSKAPSGNPIAVWSNITYIFYKTADTISPGSTPITKIGELRLYNGNGQYKSVDIQFDASTVALGTCSVPNTSININMPRADAKNFDGIGSTSSENGSEKAFEIPLNCNNGTRANIQINGDAEDASRGVLKLTPGSGTASGVGLQLRYKDNPVSLGTLFFIDTAKKTGDFNIPMSARYIQTKDQIKPGRADSTATFILKYR